MQTHTHAQTHTHTHRVFLGQQLLIVLSVTAELFGELHLAVDGLSQVLGQDVVMSLWVKERPDEGRSTSAASGFGLRQQLIVTGSSFSALTSWQRRLLTSSCSCVSA